MAHIKFLAAATVTRSSTHGVQCRGFTRQSSVTFEKRLTTAAEAERNRWGRLIRGLHCESATVAFTIALTAPTKAESQEP